MGLPGSASGENPPAYAGDPREAVLIPGLGRSPEIGSGTHSSILSCNILWTESSCYRPETQKSDVTAKRVSKGSHIYVYTQTVCAI